MIGARTTRMNRRILLRGLGGACVTAPFLGSLGWRSARASEPRAPQRLIAMFTYCGCITTRFFPEKSHGVLTAADLTPTTLRPLAPYVDKLLIPRGIRTMNEWTSNMLRGQGNDTHLNAAASYFTCQPVTPNSDDPFNFDTAVKFNAKPVGPSLDHVMAQQLSPDGEPLFMRIGNRTDSALTAISYSAKTTQYPGVGDPLEIYSALTGLFTDGEQMSSDTYQAARGKSVLDLVKDDLDTLQRFDLSQADRNKLEAWKALLHETTPVVRPAACNSTAATALGATQENAQVVAGVTMGGDVLGTPVANGMDGADLYSNLAVLAAVCNANPVIFLRYPGTYVFESLGITYDNWGLAQRIGSASMLGTCVEDAVGMLLKIDDYYTRKFAYLVGLLDSIQEGDGTVLDNSATVWFQEVSDGCARNLNNLPIIQAGGAGGYFRTGCTINVEDGSADLTRGNSEVFCTTESGNMANGISQESGTDPTLANAPINKYYCSLMNALGVKAGEDGFPLKGGSAEVTHFGMYDKTEDFIHGGTNPPRITNPGEFTALKASS